MQMSSDEIVNRIKNQYALKKGMGFSNKDLTSPYCDKLIRIMIYSNEIVVVGAGVYGERLFEMLEAEGIANKVCCICDNSIERRRFNSFPIDVLSVEEAVINYPDALYVITPRFYENELLQQLVDLGVPVKQIMIFTFAYTGLIDG